MRVEEDGYNGFLPGVKTTRLFLDEAMGRPNNDDRQQCLNGLRSVLNDSPTEDLLRQWVRSYYGQSSRT